MPASGMLKITKVTYYVVGTKDSYVRLYVGHSLGRLMF